MQGGVAWWNWGSGDERPSWNWMAGFGDEREQHCLQVHGRLGFSETGRGEQRACVCSRDLSWKAVFSAWRARLIGRLT